MEYIIALDQGTTSSRAILFNMNQEIISVSQKEIEQIYPREGWVEHDPMEIYRSQYDVLNDVISKSGIPVEDIKAIGITNQRETTVIWDKETGIPVANAIVWQCRRTAPLCEELKAQGLEPYVRENTGLLIDAYFSGTKICWLLDNIKGAREKAEAGKLLFGTVDTWLLWKLTEGRTFKTDRTNASRTMLYNIKECKWDDYLLKKLHIPSSLLPEVCPSISNFGYMRIKGHEIPITGIAGDQQAALFGQGCFREGEIKNTYGTGCFLLMHTGKKLCHSQNGLITTIAAGGEEVEYAIEGSVFTGGAVIQWLRDELHLVMDAKETESYATAVPDNGGVYMIPAFTGLGAPHWDMYARGTILGITRGTKRNHLVRAALESIAYQCQDIIAAIEEDANIPVNSLKVDGGASSNNFLISFQADITRCPIHRPPILETTALGAMRLAAMGAGVYQNIEETQKEPEKTFLPKMSIDKRNHYLKWWKKALEHSKNWLEKEGEEND